MGDNAPLEKHLKKTTIISNVVGLFIALSTALSVGYAFYYKTSYTQTEHTKSIYDLKTDVTEIKVKLNEATLSTGISGSEINSLKDRMDKMEQNQNRIEDKIDKILFQTKPGN